MGILSYFSLTNIVIRLMKNCLKPKRYFEERYLIPLLKKQYTLSCVKLIIRKGLAFPSPLTELFYPSTFLAACSFSPCISTKQICAYALQSVLEEIKCNEPQLSRLKEKAQQLWEEQAASKNFVHRVSQLSSFYLALSNLTKVMLLYVLLCNKSRKKIEAGLLKCCISVYEMASICILKPVWLKAYHIKRNIILRNRKQTGIIL